MKVFSYRGLSTIMTDMNSTCPLCEGQEIKLFHTAKNNRKFFRCNTCSLTFLDRAQRLTPEEEKKRYDTHNNDPQDKKYRNFLNRLRQPMLKHLKPGAKGLDFGSGPGPTLSLMFNEQGFPTKHYDPIYEPDNSLLKETYDFISCSEVAEHMYEPHKEFKLLKDLLNPGGILGVMTKIMGNDSDFADWHYAQDPTHVCFYKKEVFNWISTSFALDIISQEKNIVIFQKQ
ncbi:methyltransferase domain-containing protein [Candidatus Margulisiibacteriota bacterium]